MVDAVNTSRRIRRSGHVFSRRVRPLVITTFRCSEAISEGQCEGFRIPLAPLWTPWCPYSNPAKSTNRLRFPGFGCSCRPLADQARHRIRLVLTYSMRTNQHGRLLRLIALGPYKSPRSDGWERWQARAADETTADAPRTSICSRRRIHQGLNQIRQPVMPFAPHGSDTPARR